MARFSGGGSKGVASEIEPSVIDELVLASNAAVVAAVAYTFGSRIQVRFPQCGGSEPGGNNAQRDDCLRNPPRGHQDGAVDCGAAR